MSKIVSVQCEIGTEILKDKITRIKLNLENDKIIQLVSQDDGYSHSWFELSGDINTLIGGILLVIGNVIANRKVK